MKNLLKQEPAIIVGTVQSLLALVAAFGFDLISPEQAAAIIAAVSAFTLLLRGLIYSPATAEQIKEQREVLAKAVRAADTTGSVPFAGTKVARKVLEGAVNTIIPPALTAALVAAGFPANFAAMVGPEAAKIALEASRNATKKALTSEQLKASRDAELERRAAL